MLMSGEEAPYHKEIRVVEIVAETKIAFKTLKTWVSNHSLLQAWNSSSRCSFSCLNLFPKTLPQRQHL